MSLEHVLARAWQEIAKIVWKKLSNPDSRLFWGAIVTRPWWGKSREKNWYLGIKTMGVGQKLEKIGIYALKFWGAVKLLKKTFFFCFKMVGGQSKNRKTGIFALKSRGGLKCWVNWYYRFKLFTPHFTVLGQKYQFFSRFSPPPYHLNARIPVRQDYHRPPVILKQKYQFFELCCRDGTRLCRPRHPHATVHLSWKNLEKKGILALKRWKVGEKLEFFWIFALK